MSALLNDSVSKVTTIAPSTCANVIAGFDILGFATPEFGDTVTVIRKDEPGLTIEIDPTGHPSPAFPERNVATVVIRKAMEALRLEAGFHVKVHKDIPLSSGLGGSAASAVAAIVAFNKFLNQPFAPQDLLYYALFGEAKAGGQAHADNVVSCLVGGLNLVFSIEPIEYVSLPPLPVPCVLVHPHLRIATKHSRQVLRPNLLLLTHVQQTRYLSALITGLYRQDIALIAKGLQDIIIEPQRAKILPSFYHVKDAALDNGALAASFSGSGPSMFALAPDAAQAQKIGKAMQAAFVERGIPADYWVTRVSEQGARVISSR